MSRFVCLECAAGPFSERAGLVAHWNLAGHGPKQVEADAIDRARVSIMGDKAPPPRKVIVE